MKSESVAGDNSKSNMRKPSQLAKYAETRKELLQLVHKLRAMGAQAVIDVPRVVVIGNQSAGKSSVVESISGLSVPRDSGTCTRCPMECRMSSADEWSCQISIRWEYEADNLKKKDVSEVPFGDLIADPREVELQLRRAQAAVLNPHVRTHDFLTMSAHQIKAGVKSNVKPLLFSRNVVCVDLQGPDLVDLSFIDLPGLIQVADDPMLLQLVEKLVVDHIAGNSLILVVVPMSDDLDNQRALTLSRNADPEGKRTIGVITKPDVVGKGSKSRDLYLSVIEGHSRTLLHGYFCTRQPDDDDREGGLTHAEAREIEAHYFATERPWCDSQHKHRFGIKNLVATLSPLLEKIIRISLPTLREETAKQLEQCRAELKALPEVVTTEPTTHMLGLITSFCNDTSERIKGSEGCEELIQKNRVTYGLFKKYIHATAPRFKAEVRPQGSSKPRVNGTASQPAHGDESESEDEDEDEDEDEEDGESAQESEAESDDTSDDEDSGDVPTDKFVYLDDMRIRIERSITRELPNNVPFAVKSSLVREFQGQWAHAADMCLDRVLRDVNSALLQCVDHTLGRWDSLRTHARYCVEQLIKKRYDCCVPFIQAALEIERMPYTQNLHYLQSCQEKWLGRYKDARAGRSAVPPAQTQQQDPHAAFMPTRPTVAKKEFSFVPIQPQVDPIAKALASLAEAGYTGLSADDLGRLNKADEYETEMQVMAEVRSYFQVSYKRIIDSIPMLIDLKFVRGIMQDMHDHLIREMGLAGDGATERCARYLAEDPDVVARRDEALARRATLESVQKELNNFENSF
ncbi:P-loop containing nucleoside triphosphate hydrolase protein [Dentipellis sp. KUC8613]|nr:P-loop containing nucleoside triphosphate hydrolase protein [Dentipellis sp. KUC8613]